MRSYFRTPAAPLLAAFAALSLAAAAPAAPQDSTTPTARQQQPQPATAPPITTLDRALEQVPWDPEPRGPLLVVAPASVRAWTPKRSPEEPYGYTPPPPLPPVPPGGYRMNVVAPHFGRKLVRLDTLSVLAPTEMVVFNTRPGKPDLFAGLRRGEKIRLLQASLSPAQWRQLGGEQGLGASDLTAEQRALFLSLLPDPFKVRRYTVHKGGGWGYRGSPKETDITLSPAQRAGVRLRLSRGIELMLPYANQPNAFTSVSSRRPEGTEFLGMASGMDWYPRPDVYGVTLRQEVPNRLKPGELNFEAPALQAAISLEDAKTVGDLVKRAADAARVEIIADARVASLPVWTKGASARAGDVLKALCYAVTGAFRKVGTLYLLTNDVIGIGTRRTFLSEWYRTAQLQEQAQREELNRRIQKQQPLQYIGYGQEDAGVLKPETLQNIEQGWNTREGRYKRHQIPVTALPPAQQEIVQQTVASRSEQAGSPQINGSQVHVSVRLRLSYIAPGVGVIDTQEGFSGSPQEMLPPLPPPVPAAAASASSPDAAIPFLPSMTARILYVAPATPEAAAQAVAAAAQRRGITHVWIDTPIATENAAGKEIVAAAIAAAAGKEKRVPIFAVIRLLQTPPAAAPAPDAPALALDALADSRDLNLLGETAAVWAARQAALSPTTPQLAFMKETYGRMGDWLRPDAPTVAALLKQRLAQIAALPGLAGIALRDTAAPGYTDPGSSRSFSMDNADYGYTLENRLAFLRQQSIDPIDLGSRTYIGVDTNLPFFSDQGPRLIRVDGRMVEDTAALSPQQRWNELRYKKNAALLADLYATVRAAAARPDLPLYIRDRISFGFGFGGWYGSWDKPDTLPRSALETLSTPEALFRSARSQARRVLLSHSYSNVLPPPGLADNIKPYTPESLAFQLKMLLGHATGNWDGFVLDLSDIPLEKALPMLEGLTSGPPRTTAAQPRPQ